MSNTTPDTMAEAFCNEHLTAGTKHGEKNTGWEDKDIYTDMRGITQTSGVTMFQARAITLFHAVRKNGYHMTITMFRDRSWMVHESPTSGEMVMVGTKENEHQILDLIHEELNTSLEGLAQEFEVDVLDVLAQAKDISEPEPQPEREPPEFPTHTDAPREQ